MPAKKEFLTSPGHRALKITAGLIGGYCLAVSLQMLIGTLLPYRKEIILTGAFSVFILWVIFMILAFLSRNGWRIWLIYLLASTAFSLLIYFLKP